MSDKRGFTLVELIAVIVVLAIVIALVAPSMLDSSRATKEKTFKTKVNIIETSAVMYGQDNYRNIINGVNAGEAGYSKQTIDGVEFYTQTVKIKDLIPAYVTKDEEDGPQYVQDPRENGKYLDEYTITIMINQGTRKVTAKFNES